MIIASGKFCNQELIRQGGKHDIFHNPETGASQPVPRHREINDILAKKIIRDLSN